MRRRSRWATTARRHRQGRSGGRGAGGYGNPHFHSATSNPAPKFATRGYEGERVALELELPADVGLAGAPNAGKSTLLLALTAGRAQSAVAGYAFTTLNPVVGVVRVAEDGSFVGGGGGGEEDGSAYDETVIKRRRERALMESGAYADASPSRDAREEQLLEAFRFTLADNPGLIQDALDNVGLGHSFLRSMERSLALVYVVDLSGAAPWDELRMLRSELENSLPNCLHLLTFDFGRHLLRVSRLAPDPQHQDRFI